jgi:hypothetical protein
MSLLARVWEVECRLIHGVDNDAKHCPVLKRNTPANMETEALLANHVQMPSHIFLCFFQSVRVRFEFEQVFTEKTVMRRKLPILLTNITYTEWQRLANSTPFATQSPNCKKPRKRSDAVGLVDKCVVSFLLIIRI